MHQGWYGMTKEFLIDMDGVIYRGNELIAGANQFISELTCSRHSVSFPNQQQPAHGRDVAMRLRRMGIEAEELDIFTCAMATARFLARQKSGGTAYVIGEGGLLQALHESGYAIVDHEPDYVVVGEGRAFTMEQVEIAVRMVINGAKLIATNLDPNCPTADGLRPGCGAIVCDDRSGHRPQGIQRRQAQSDHDARRPQAALASKRHTLL